MVIYDAVRRALAALRGVGARRCLLDSSAAAEMRLVAADTLRRSRNGTDALAGALLLAAAFAYGVKQAPASWRS